MATIRPAKCYSQVKGPANTRKSVRVHRRNYVGGIPGSKIRMFDIGNLNGSFNRKYDLITEHNGQIRHSALEAVRTTLNRYLGRTIGKVNYKIKIRIYPHHILRENKQYTGAGADRIQQGMRKSFGKATSLAARVQANQKIISIESDKQFEKEIRAAIRKAQARLPMTTRFEILTQKKLKVTAKMKVSEEDAVPVDKAKIEDSKEKSKNTNSNSKDTKAEALETKK